MLTAPACQTLRWLPAWTVRTRIIVWTCLLVIVLVIGLLVLLMQMQGAAMESMSQRLAGLTGQLESQQREVVDRVAARQQANTQAALEAKAKSLAEIVAKLAPVPLLTFETAVLDSYCSQACGDCDVVLCYVSNADKKIQTSIRNEKDPELIALIGEPRQRSVAEVAEALRKTGNVLEVSADVVQEGRGLGQAVLLLSKRGVTRQQAEVQEGFDGLMSGMKGLLAGMQGQLGDDMQQRRSRMLQMGALAGLVAVLLGVAAAIQIAGSIARPLRQAVEVLEAVAAGDLTQRLDLRTRDEMGRMAGALNVAVEASANALEEVRWAAQRDTERQRLQAEEDRRRAEDERRQAEAMQRKVDEILSVVNLVARGDYSRSIAVDGDDALGQMARGLRQFFSDKEASELRERQQQQRERDEQRALSEKVDALLQVVAAAAEGDLTRPIPFGGDDPVGRLAAGLGKMLADLRTMVRDLIDNAGQFRLGAATIAEGSQALAGGAIDQSTSVASVNQSINQLAARIDAINHGAAAAEQLALATNRQAGVGNEAVSRLDDAMQRVKASSQQIAEINQLVAQIASQTNLLALNAAIEAARAGHHGLGFAVVADEVRKLAQRSNQAATQISKLIQESVQRVDEGWACSHQTQASLVEIQSGVQATLNKICEIAQATVDQSQHARAMAGSIDTVARVAAQVAAQSEEMASNSEELGGQSDALHNMVSRFRVV